MLKKFIISVSFIVFLVLVGCGDQGTTQTSGNKQPLDSLKVYTTLYPLQYFANIIGGVHVDVETILPAGANPHTFEPTSKTMVDIASADLFIYNQAQMEAYAEKIEAAIATEDVLTVEAAKGIELTAGKHKHVEKHGTDTDGVDDEHEHHEDEEAHNHGEFDPHVWLDPIRAITMAENIKNALISLKPEQRQEFEANFIQLKIDLEKLDEVFHRKISSLQKYKILVAHAAYGYWEQSYGVEQIAITGISSSAEPSQKELEEIMEEVKENDIDYIFYEQNVTPKVAEVLQNELSVEPLYIHNLSVLTEGDVANNEDYFSLMNKNIEALVKALREK